MTMIEKCKDFKELMTDKNVRAHRIEVGWKVAKISEDKVKKTLKRIKSGKAVVLMTQGMQDNIRIHQEQIMQDVLEIIAGEKIEKVRTH